MKVVLPSAKIIGDINGVAMLKHIELCGRVCYKSEERITDYTYISFVKRILASGHESVLEHASITAQIVCDRWVSHEIVRHRLASYSQVSTRYVDYRGKEMEFVRPPQLSDSAILLWQEVCEAAESAYKQMRESGVSPQIARSVLPNSLATELNMTANLREWRHFFKMRCAPDAHPQMREVACMLLAEMRSKIPVIFDEDYE